MSNSRLAPRDYRKLHNLHTSVQSDKAIRLPKQKPGFSYTSGREPSLPFLHKREDYEDILRVADSDNDEFPSPSEMVPTPLVRNLGLVPFQSFNIQDEDVAPSSFPDNSLASLEAGMIELFDTALMEEPSAKFDSSFANDVFDFDAFNSKTPRKPSISPPTKDLLKNEPASTTIVNCSLKRDRSATPELQQAKHRRVMKEEPISQATQAAVPHWVNDIDSDLINELKGFVDFVD